MAQLIDRAALWSFTAASCLLFMLTLTDGNLLISVSASFLLVLILRLIIKRIPERRFVRRRERAEYILSLLKAWSIMEPSEAISQIRHLLPDLFTDSEWPRVILLQRYPTSEALNANRLIEIRRAHRNHGTNELIILSTGPADASAAALAADLSNPSVRLTDSKQLTRRLLRIIRTVPIKETKKERRKPFTACFAHFSASVRPIHAAAYFILFGLLYSFTRSTLYLLAALIFAFLLLIWTIGRIQARSV